ncbi:uncharacterized protein [Miscanthus floridulus]|uniref:uncharacterized protein n=1 Tax=Miscanthus floridulus TaxID=154761 RepID=UPI003459CAFF
MQEMFWEEFWRKWGRPRELYPDASSKDAIVPPALPVPNGDCGFPAHVFQSKHLDIVARCFYTCSRFNDHERCFFFQQIDGADKFDPRYLLFDDWFRGRHPREHFKRWVLPPNPPPLTAKEKHLATVRRLEEPSLCDCGDRAVINPKNMLEFVCPNKHKAPPLSACSTASATAAALAVSASQYFCFLDVTCLVDLPLDPAGWRGGGL